MAALEKDTFLGYLLNPWRPYFWPYLYYSVYLQF